MLGQRAPLCSLCSDQSLLLVDEVLRGSSARAVVVIRLERNFLVVGRLKAEHGREAAMVEQKQGTLDCLLKKMVRTKTVPNNRGKDKGGIPIPWKEVVLLLP